MLFSDCIVLTYTPPCCFQKQSMIQLLLCMHHYWWTNWWRRFFTKTNRAFFVHSQTHRKNEKIQTWQQANRVPFPHWEKWINHKNRKPGGNGSQVPTSSNSFAIIADTYNNCTRWTAYFAQMTIKLRISTFM